MKLIASFCLPLMIGQFFQQFYNMVDSIIIGRFAGTAELSAVGSTGSLSFMVIGFVSGICAGFAIPVAQSFGAGDYTKLRKYFANSVYLSAFFSVVLSAVTMIFTRPVLELMNTPESIIDMAHDYIFIIFSGLTATIFYNLFASVLRAIGDSKTPLYFLIFSSVLNIILDLFFVVVLKMACKGVAIATVIAQLISAVLCLIVIKRRFEILHISGDEWKLDFKLCSRLLYIGVPMALQFSITAVGSIMLQSAVNTLGENVIAAVTVGGKIQLLVVLPAETIGLTMATYCGQNLGARKIDRIKKGINSALILAAAYCVIATCISFFFGETLSLLFVGREQTQVVSLVGRFLKICSLIYPALIVLFVYRNSIQGLGYSIPAMLAGFFELAARSVMGFFIIPRFGYDAVCLANPMAWIAADILLIPTYYIVYNKVKKKILKKSVDFNEDLS